MSSNLVFPPASETVLVVENETAIRNLVQMALERHGYHILAAESGADALRVADGHHGRIDLLISDVVLPDTNGPEIARRLSTSHPELHTLFMSGYLDDALGEHGLSGHGVDFIQKAFSPRVLALKVREILDRSRDPMPSASTQPPTTS